MLHVISLLVENHQGVMSRISGLFAGRGYNMESITVGPTIDPTMARITLVCKGDEAVITQIKKQLNKLIEVIKVIDLNDVPSIYRELALIKVSTKSGKRGELFQLTEAFRGKVVDVGMESMVIEITGAPEKIDGFITLAQEFPLLEMARSGVVALERSKKTKKQ